jgi:hypothetical protein
MGDILTADSFDYVDFADFGLEFAWVTGAGLSS